MSGSNTGGMFNIDYVTMVQSIAADAAINGPVWQLVNAVCYVMALIFAFRAAVQLKDVAEQKTQSYTTPMLTFMAAALLAAAPSSVASVSATVFGSGVATSPLAYTSTQVGASPIKAVLTLIQLIGYIFFIRGIMELKRAGEPQRFQGASVNKSLVIMLSGMAAIYINYTLQVVGSMTGWNVDSIVN